MMQISKPSFFTFYQIISATFCLVVVISNLVSSKMMRLPFIDLTIPVGVLTYPITFLLADLVTEIFGPKKAKLMVYIALGMNLLSLAMIQFALFLPNVSEKEQVAFQAVLGLSGLRIFSSLIAYLFSQIIDIQLYAIIKKWTGSKYLWLRNNGSTCISQFIDTVLVDMIYLYWGLAMGLNEVIPIILITYAYKTLLSFACTPLFYLSVFLVKTNWKLPKFENSFQNQGAVYEPRV